MDKFKIIKLLSDGSRYNIVTTLLDYDELYVTEILSLLHLKQANTSKHLKILKEAGIVESKRDGNIVKYSINNDFLKSHLMLVKYLIN
jgi:ArsR family transcriptional regulator